MTSNPVVRVPQPEWVDPSSPVARYADAIVSWLENSSDPWLFLPVLESMEASWSDPLGVAESSVRSLHRGMVQAPCPWTDNPAVYRWWFATDADTGAVVATSSVFRLDAGDYWTRVAQAYGSDVLTWPLDLRRVNYLELRRMYRRTTRVAMNWRRSR